MSRMEVTYTNYLTYLNHTIWVKGLLDLELAN